VSYIGNQPSQVAFVTDSFSGNGSTTAFTMSVAPANTASVLVAVSGVLQDPSTYSVSGLTLTFTGAPPSGTSNISARYLGIPASGVTTTAYSTRTEFTATAGQTTFTPPSYTVGFIQVYRNGVLLGTADYTATNGTTVVLATGATVNDLVTTISFYVSSVLNAIPATAGSVGSTYLASNLTLSGTTTIPTGTITTLNASTGVLATQNGMTGIAKAWVQFNASSGACVIGSSFNVSSVTYVSTGVFTVNITTAMPNTTYAWVGTIGATSGTFLMRDYSDVTAKTTSSFTLTTQTSGGASSNPAYVGISVFSS